MRIFVLVAIAFALAVPGSARAAQRLVLDEPRLQVHHDAPELTNVRLALSEAPLFARDQGSGARALDGDGKQVVGFLLGFLIGFGIGHLVIGARDGFVFWLLIDVVTIAIVAVSWSILPDIVGVLTTLGFVFERVFQGYDAYVTAGGKPMKELSMDALVPVREVRLERPSLAPAVRAFAVAF